MVKIDELIHNRTPLAEYVIPRQYSGDLFFSNKLVALKISNGFQLRRCHAYSAVEGGKFKNRVHIVI